MSQFVRFNSFVHPDLGPEHTISVKAFPDFILIRCRCGENMDIDEPPGRESFITTFARIIEHCEVNGASEFPSSKIAAVLDHAQRLESTREEEE